MPLLRALHVAGPEMRRAIIRAADASLLQTLSECSLNVLQGNQPVSPRCKRVLARYKGELRRLASPLHQVPLNAKRRILEQRGGFLGALLSTVLGGLLSKLVS